MTASQPAYPLVDALAQVRPGDPDGLYAAFLDWVGGSGLDLYPHQDDAIVALLSPASKHASRLQVFGSSDGAVSPDGPAASRCA